MNFTKQSHSLDSINLIMIVQFTVKTIRDEYAMHLAIYKFIRYMHTIPALYDNVIEIH